MHSRHIFRVLLVVVALQTAACGGDGPAGSSESIAGLKVYRHAMDQAPSTLDPVQASNIYANHVALNAYDTLFSYKYLARPYTLKPNLAAGFPEISEDELTYTIRIKQGVRFVDDPAFPDGKGRELVASDFVYSIKRQFDPAQLPNGTWLWIGRIVGLDAWKEAGSDYSVEVEGLRALDDYTIRIELKRPYPQLLDTFAQGYSAIVPREAVEYYGKEFASHPVGSGPFKVISYDTAKIVFERNKYYRQEPVDIWYEGYDPETQAYTGVEAIDGRSPPFIDRLEIDFIGEDAARWNSFTKGNEVQFTVLPNEQVDQVLSSKHPVTFKPEYAEKYNGYDVVEAGFVFNAFNMDHPEFGYRDDPVEDHRNKLLRCALIKAWDWQARNESFYFGLAKIYPGIIPPVVPEYDPDLSRDSVIRDVAESKRLLAEGGWTKENLPEFVYGSTSGIKTRLFFEQIRSWFKEVGYPPEKMKHKQYATFGDLSKAWRNSELPYVAKAWGLDYPDAENTLQLFYGPNGTPGSNDANYKNPQYDALYEQSAVMRSSPERTRIYRKMNRLVIDDCVAQTGLSRTRIFMWHKNVIALPDRQIVGGFFLKYVDLKTDDADQAQVN